MANRDYNYLIKCAAHLETDKSVGKSYDGDEIIHNAFVCGMLWSFIQAYYLYRDNCDVRLDDHLISFTIGLVISGFLGGFFTEKFIKKRNDKWRRTYETILADLKK